MYISPEIVGLFMLCVAMLSFQKIIIEQLGGTKRKEKMPDKISGESVKNHYLIIDKWIRRSAKFLYCGVSLILIFTIVICISRMHYFELSLIIELITLCLIALMGGIIAFLSFTGLMVRNST